MISSLKGIFKISGEHTDIIFELNMILEYFVKKSPETLGGALAIWGDKLKAALSTDDINAVALEEAKELTEHYISRDLSEHFNNLQDEWKMRG